MEPDDVDVTAVFWYAEFRNS